MSTSARKRHRAVAAAAAVDERNSWLSTEIQRCQYPGCMKFQYDRIPERKFCGLWHRDLYMSKLANSRSSSPTPAPGQELFTISCLAAIELVEGNNPKCMLPECTKSASRDPNTGQHFEFCSMKDTLKMVERMTTVWSLQGRLCRLEDCCQHVHVEDDGRCRDYCGRTHAKLAAARKGAMVRQEAASAAASNLEAVQNTSGADNRVNSNVHDERDERGSQNSGQQAQGDEATVQRLIDTSKGYHAKIIDEDLHRLLKGESAVGGVEGYPSVVTGMDIYKFHPWELVSKNGGSTPRYFLHHGQTPKKRTTKDGFSWKQTGRRHPNSNKLIKTRYMSYKQGKSKGKDEDKFRWRLREITLPDSCNKSKTNCRMVIWRIAKKPRVPSNTSEEITPQAQTHVPMDKDDIAHEGLGIEPPDNADMNSVQVQCENDTGSSEGALNFPATFGPSDTQMDFGLAAFELNEGFNHREDQVRFETSATIEDLYDFTNLCNFGSIEERQTDLWNFDFTEERQTDPGLQLGANDGHQKQSGSGSDTSIFNYPFPQADPIS